MEDNEVSMSPSADVDSPPQESLCEVPSKKLGDASSLESGEDTNRPNDPALLLIGFDEQPNIVSEHPSSDLPFAKRESREGYWARRCKHSR